MKKSDALQRYIENQAIEWLVKLNNPAITDDEVAAFNQWLSDSAAHQLAYINAEHLWQASEKLINQKASRSVVMQWRYAFATFLVVICASLYQMTRDKTTVQEYYTGVGEQKILQLADGSTIKLNNQTHLIFSINNKSRKAHLLAGEVLFEVKPDKNRPFDVETHDGMVRVLGTYFSVNRYAASTLVTVVDGRVALGRKPLEKEAFVASKVLVQSQQQTIAEAISGKEPRHVDAKSELAWVDHQLIVRGEMLSKVLVDLEKVFPVKFVIQSQNLGEKRITAVLNLSDLDQVLLVLETSLSLQIERTPTEVRLSEKK